MGRKPLTEDERKLRIKEKNAKCYLNRKEKNTAGYRQSVITKYLNIITSDERAFILEKLSGNIPAVK